MEDASSEEEEEEKEREPEEIHHITLINRKQMDILDKHGVGIKNKQEDTGTQN